jgi:homoserine O-acetyltransferase
MTAARVERAGLARRAIRGSLLLLVLGVLACRPGPQVARLGDLPTEHGEVIRDCRIVFRTSGRLNADRSNAVLLVPWFMGTGRELERQVGPEGLVDDSRDFVIVVDALGNGVSSSPSNSPLQPGARFPQITIRDMVASQYQLVTSVLGLHRLKAVVGVSMGGMQAFSWAIDHPGFAARVVSVVGSPRTPSSDRRRWEAGLAEVRDEPAWRRAARALGRLEPGEALRQARMDPVDYQRQAEAILDLDLTDRFGGSLARAASAIRSTTLVVVSARDETVDPAPARELAPLAGADLLVLDGRCGHQAPSCERVALRAAVRRFLAAPAGDSAGSP